MWGVWESIKDVSATVGTSIADASSKIVEVYKEDLAEFSTAVVEDTQILADQVTKALADQDEEAGEDSMVREVPRNRFEALLSDLERDVGTFCSAPPAELLSQWKARSGFTMESVEAEIREVLPRVSEHHKNFVPLVVSYEEFWTRYFFAVAQLKQKEEDRAEMIKRAAHNVSATVEEEEGGWGDDLDDSDASQDVPAAAAAAAAAPAAEPESESESESEPTAEPAAGQAVSPQEAAAGKVDPVQEPVVERVIDEAQETSVLSETSDVGEDTLGLDTTVEDSGAWDDLTDWE